MVIKSRNIERVAAKKVKIAENLYLITNHLGNVRMLLTEEQQQDQYPAATLEGTYSTAAPEAVSMINYEKKFYTINNIYAVASNTMPGWTTAKDYANNNGNPPYNLNYPAGTTPAATATATKVYKLNATTNKTGLGMVLKVMAGDKIDIHGKSYYQSTTTYNNTNSTVLTLSDIVGAFIGSPDNAGFGSKGITSGTMQTINTGQIPGSFIRGNDGSSSTIPKAYINYIFFDEQFKYAGGGFSRAGASGSVKPHWNTDPVLQNIAVPKNGYLYVYISNESNANVFFDNLQVFHTRGALLNEDHYYPYGGQLYAISSKSAGSLENRKKYNGIDKESDLQIDVYDAQLRELDGQIGRWWQIDPKIDDMKMWSPYASNYNNPILYSDPLGDEPECCLGEFMATLRNAAGFKYTTNKSFAKGMVEVAKDPNTYANAILTIGPIVGTGLAMFMTDGALAGTTSRVVASRTIATAEVSTAVSLETRAKEIQSTLSSATQRINTSAVASSSKIESSAPNFIVDSKGTAFPVPKGATGPTPVINNAGNQTGVAFTGGKGGANGKVSTIRLMDATPAKGNSPGYPNGYIKFENISKQGVDPYSGKTLPNSQSHFPISGVPFYYHN
jgi:RHS repeat-associated protein